MDRDGSSISNRVPDSARQIIAPDNVPRSMRERDHRSDAWRPGAPPSLVSARADEKPIDRPRRGESVGTFDLPFAL